VIIEGFVNPHEVAISMLVAPAPNSWLQKEAEQVMKSSGKGLYRGDIEEEMIIQLRVFIVALGGKDS
jgi:hypothetical protein